MEIRRAPYDVGPRRFDRAVQDIRNQVARNLDTGGATVTRIRVPLRLLAASGRTGSLPTSRGASPG